MTAENDNMLEKYASRTEEFMSGQIIPISTYALNEMKDIPTYFWGFAGIFPRLPIGQRPGFLLFSTEKGRDIRGFQSRIHTLQLPERVMKLNIAKSETLVRASELICATQNLPSIVLAIGDQEGFRDDALLLMCIPGLRPEQALRRIQERTLEAIARGN